MDRRTLAPLVFVPIAVFLTVMLCVALLVTHPPTLGWIGLGVAATLALLAGTLVVVFFPRGRTSADRRHAHAGDVYRLLVVVDVEVEPAELRSAVKLRTLGRRSAVLVVAPVVTPSPLHFLTDDEGAEHAAADERLTTVLGWLEAEGIEARGIVGTDDPLQAAGDALVEFEADEILLVASFATARSWQERGFEQQARDLLGVPVSTVHGPAARTSA